MARIRRQFKIDSITDPILAGCDKEKKKKKFHLGAECRKWEKVFKSISYPTTLLVDKNAVVKYMPSGFMVRFTADNKTIRPDTVSADHFLKELEKKMEN